MNNLIAILSALPVREVKPLALPALPSDLTDVSAMLAYSAKCIEAKASWEKENNIDPAAEVAIACAHLLATLPADKLGSVAEDAAKRARNLQGLVTFTKKELSDALLSALRGESEFKLCAVADLIAIADAENFNGALRAARFAPNMQWLREVDSFRNGANKADMVLTYREALGAILKGEKPFAPPAPEEKSAPAPTNKKTKGK